MATCKICNNTLKHSNIRQSGRLSGCKCSEIITNESISLNYIRLNSRIADKKCLMCDETFENLPITKWYCSSKCKIRGHRAGINLRPRRNVQPLRKLECPSCRGSFDTTVFDKIYCSDKCCQRVSTMRKSARLIEGLSASGVYVTRRKNYSGRWSPEEISSLRADPLCKLPDRSLAAQWKKCFKLGIDRDRSLYADKTRSPEAARQRAARAPAKWRRQSFRRRVRANPEPTLAELRNLARGNPHAEDLILEGFATVLRLAIPAAEAFKLAKAEVNRTSAQPFKEQSFNPDIDYAGRETGRQVSRASDIRSVRGES